MGIKSHVLFIASAGERGGAEVVLLNILRHLDRSQFIPSVVCLQEGAFIEELKEQARVAVEVVPMDRYRNLGRAWAIIRRIRRTILRGGVRLVHCNGTGAHLYGGLAAWLCNVPSVYHIHDVVEWSWTRQGLVHLVACLVPARATITVSHYVARRFHQSWRSSRTIDVIHNAIADSIKENPTSDIRNLRFVEWGWPSDSPLVVWCGRLQRWKGTHIFLRAAALARQQVPMARFLVVGGRFLDLDAEYEREVRALAQELHLNGCLRFTGHQLGARSYIAAADVLVHTSIDPEPFGLVILEAMVLGKPVIASGEGGPVEIIQPGVTGLLIPPSDSEALARAIIQILQDGALRAEMGKAAQERAERCFNIQQMMRQIEGLYERVICETCKGKRTGSNAFLEN